MLGQGCTCRFKFADQAIGHKSHARPMCGIAGPNLGNREQSATKQRKGFVIRSQVQFRTAVSDPQNLIAPESTSTLGRVVKAPRVLRNSTNVHFVGT